MEKRLKVLFYVSALGLIFIYIMLEIMVPLINKKNITTMSGITYFEGEGTKDFPYLINNGLDLVKLGELVNGGEEFRNTYFEQTQSLNMESIRQFIPIGKYGSEHYFYGIYNGAGYKIYNLNINGEGENSALFGQLGGIVMNLGIESGVIQGAYIGSIASHAVGLEAKIINCYNKATLKGRGRAGGIADNFGKGQIINCWNEGSIEAPTIGGICSYTAGNIYNSYCESGDIVNEYFNGKITLLGGKNWKSKSELADKMNEGIQFVTAELALEENNFVSWAVIEEEIVFREME